MSATFRHTLRLERLEDRTNPASSPPSAFVSPPLDTPIPADAILTTAGPGELPYVSIRRADGTALWYLATMDYAPTDTPGPGSSPPYFGGGVRAALGDVTGDGVPDVVVAAGPSGGPRVQVFDGTTYAEVRSFYAYDPDFSGGVNVATGDVTGDGVADIVTGAGFGGGPHVKVFDGQTGAEVRSFYAYDPAFRGGVSVATAAFTQTAYRNGVADPTTVTAPALIMTGAGYGGGPHVKAFNSTTGTEVQSFYAFAPDFAGGVSVAVLDTRSTSGNSALSTTSAGPFILAVGQVFGGRSVTEYIYDNGRGFRTGEPVGTFEPSLGSDGIKLSVRRHPDPTATRVDSLVVAAGQQALVYDSSFLGVAVVDNRFDVIGIYPPAPSPPSPLI